MSEFDDLSGQEIGIWKALAFDHMKWNGVNHKHGMSYYRCECKKCGAIKLKPRSNLKECKSVKHNGCGVKHANVI